VLLFVVALACFASQGGAQKKVGFVYNSDGLEHVWTRRFAVARETISREFREQILTTEVFAVDEFDRQSTRDAVEKLIDEGHSMVFMLSSGYIP
jgi:basic membrane lipoprotein Med (substrate-binding protein (PBP1-ABC) superfamily)